MAEPPVFQGFPKIPRFSRAVIFTEKIDGTNGIINVAGDGTVFAGSRNRWITPEMDNFGFAAWVKSHEIELAHYLGEGTHYGEWWGQGIQRGYGLTEKRFSLFNRHRWHDDDGIYTGPPCCDTVPLLGVYDGFHDNVVRIHLAQLLAHGSQASPGFDQPEGIIAYHSASRQYYKALLENDQIPKTVAAEQLQLAVSA